MAEILFTLNGVQTTIQCVREEKLKEIFQRYASKIGVDLNSLYFVSGGNIINEESILKEIINQLSTNEERINMLVFEKNIEVNEDNKSVIKSKNIICPKCFENCLISIKNYKISLFGCKNNDITDNILLKDFEKSQNIIITNIVCNDCNNINKNQAYNNQFYKCLTCNNNLCPLCCSNHNKSHEIIDYDLKYYICNTHNDSYISYCDKCKINLCMLCENEHNKNHNIIDYKNLIINKNIIKSEVNEFKELIDKFNNEIDKLIDLLSKLKDNMKIYYKIYFDIVNNYEIQNKNYEILKNINEIHNNMKKNDIKEIKYVINENNINLKLNKMIEIYNKMNKEVIQIENINNIIQLNDKDNSNNKNSSNNIQKIINNNEVKKEKSIQNKNKELEIDFNSIKNFTYKIEGLTFYNLSEEGNIDFSINYIDEEEKFYFFRPSKYHISFCFKYQNKWYPLIKNNKLLSGYPIIYFEDWKEIKNQIYKNFSVWNQKIKKIYKAYNEISKLQEFNYYTKSDNFYKQCEKIIRKNIILGLKIFKDEVTKYKKKNINDALTFENLAYFIIFKTENIFKDLFNCFTKEIQEILQYDYNYYFNSTNNEDKDIALYNFIIKLNNIFKEKEKEFIINKKTIKIKKNS